MLERAWRFESSRPHSMHPPGVIAEVLELGETGLTSVDIARLTGVPRRTVHAWRTGALPRHYRLLNGSTNAACDVCRGQRHEFAGLPAAYVYLLGLYLGDGSIATHPRGVYKLRITLDARYPEIVRQCSRAMHDVVPVSKVNMWNRPYGDVEVYSYSKAWPCLLPQHGRGPKHLRPIVLTDWQKSLIDTTPGLLLRGLIHSDGCRFENTGRGWRHPRYAFVNLSADIRGIFCDACAQLGLRWTTSNRTVYVSRKADVARLDAFVGPKR